MVADHGPNESRLVRRAEEDSFLGLRAPQLQARVRQQALTGPGRWVIDERRSCRVQRYRGHARYSPPSRATPTVARTDWPGQSGRDSVQVVEAVTTAKSCTRRRPPLQNMTLPAHTDTYSGWLPHCASLLEWTIPAAFRSAATTATRDQRDRLVLHN